MLTCFVFPSQKTYLWRCEALPASCGGVRFQSALGYAPSMQLYSVWDEPRSDTKPNAFLDLVEVCPALTLWRCALLRA